MKKSKIKRKRRGRPKAHIKIEENNNNIDTRDLSLGIKDDEALKAFL
jgi:hypothetical protein